MPRIPVEPRPDPADPQDMLAWIQEECADDITNIELALAQGHPDTKSQKRLWQRRRDAIEIADNAARTAAQLREQE